MLGAESRLVFPRGGPPRRPPGRHVLDVEEVNIPTPDGETLAGWFCRAPSSEQNRPAVLYFHGNGGDHTWRTGAAIRLRDHLGADVLLFSYRGYGTSTGSPSETGLYADARAAWNYLVETRKIAPGRIVLFGESLGTGVATRLASELPEYRALALQAAYTSVPEAGQVQFPWLPVCRLCRNQFASAQCAAKIKRPVWMLHGTEDPVIPFAQGEALCAKVESPKRFMKRTGLHHEDVFDGQAARDLAQFLRENR